MVFDVNKNNRHSNSFSNNEKLGIVLPDVSSLEDTIKLPIIKNDENNTVQIPILKGDETDTIEIPILKNNLDETIELPLSHILGNATITPKIRGFESDTLDIPSRKVEPNDIELPVIKKYADGHITPSSMSELSKETITLPMSKMLDDGTIELPVLRSKDNGTIEIPVSDERSEGNNFCYVFPDTTLLPALKSDLVTKYQTKIPELESTSILNLNNFKTINFPNDLNEYTKSFSLDDLTMPISQSDVNAIDSSVLIKMPGSSKKKKYLQMEKMLYHSILAISLIGIVIVGSNLYSSLSSYQNTDKEIERVQSLATTVPLVEEDNQEEIEVEEVENVQEETPKPKEEIPNMYTKYTTYTPESINFQELESINNDTEGWLIVGGTNINYPFVRGSDNNFYLSHSFDKSNNVAGWVFMDYRNKMKNLSQNTIIYAHNTRNKTMFGTLKNLLNTNKENKIEIITKDYKFIWKIFSVYTVPATTDYLTTNFATSEEYAEFLDLIKTRSKFDFDVTLDTSDKILTLSTCYTHYSRTVIHAKLIDVV